MKDCNQCGKCCLLYGGGDLAASPADIEGWENERPDIAKYVNGNKIWIDPQSGKTLIVCPWLDKVPGQNKYNCKIYFDRPEDCRHYPVRIDDMIRDECEMLEPKDLTNVDRAQQKLDEMMSDSRPPLRRP